MNILGLGIGLNFNRVIGAPLLLDKFSGAAAAYSLRALSSSTTDVVRVRRSSDNAEQDFSPSEITDGSLASWVGAGNDGFVTTWYDQAGSNDATQTTAANQPKIVDAGSLVTENGNPAIEYDGVDDEMSVPTSKSTFKFLHDGTSSSVFASVKFGNTSNPDEIYGYLATAAGSSAQIGVSLGYDDRSSLSKNNALYDAIFVGGGFAALIQNNDQITPNELKLLSTFLDADDTTLSNRLKVGIDGGTLIGSNSSSGTPSTADSTKDLHIGSSDGTAYLKGVISEIIIYDTDQLANRTAIETNINNHYSIY